MRLHDYVEYELVSQKCPTKLDFEKALISGKDLTIWLLEDPSRKKSKKQISIRIKLVDSESKKLVVRGSAFSGQHKIEISMEEKTKKIKIFRAGL